MSDINEKIPEAAAVSSDASPAVRKKDAKIALKPAIGIFFSMLAVIICLSAAVIVLALRSNDISENSEENDAVEEVFVPVVNNRVYDFFDEDDTILFDDPTYGQIWLPTLSNVPKHTYDYSGLKLENGRYTYSENGEVISRTGIDVSYHNGDINWKRVAADGVDFAILRVGYRGYESGLINLDANFHNYIKGALDAGLDVGVYFYSQAMDTEEAVEEANFVMEQIYGYDVKFPVIFDWEITEEETSRTNNAPPHVVTECAAAFCDTITDGGYTPMLYGSRKFALMKLDLSKVPKVDFWFAEYKDGHNEPSYPYNYQIWQYASDGRVDGIEGDVDMNICFADYGREAAADDAQNENNDTDENT